MYLRNLKIQNIKLIRDMVLPFSNKDAPRMWTVLVGENGLCKTSILQAIALAALGADSANGFQEIIPSLPDRRRKGSTVTVEAEFQFTPRHVDRRKYPGIVSEVKPPRLKSCIRIQPGWSLFQGESSYLYVNSGEISVAGESLTENSPQHQDPLKEARGKSLPFWFVGGYGTSRTLPLPFSSDRIATPALERLASLFDRGRIVGTGFADLLKTKLIKPYARILQHALLDQDGTLPRIDRLELRGKGGVKSAKQLVESHRFEFRAGAERIRVPATWLSQGYQATISWIADLIGQMFWDAEEEIDLEKMEGLVLIDELDLHLHPLWQSGLVRALKKTFPRIQFVITTHSPMLLPGVEKGEIIHLKLDAGGNVVYEFGQESPSLLTGSQIYEEFFGIDRLFPADLGEALYKYGYIASNPNRSDADEVEMLKHLSRLKQAGVEPGLEPVNRP